MTFTIKIKEEISKIKSTKSEVIAELSAYIRNNGHIKDNVITLSTENHFLLERIKEEVNDMYDINSQEEIIENLNFTKNNLYQLYFENYFLHFLINYLIYHILFSNYYFYYLSN